MLPIWSSTENRSSGFQASASRPVTPTAPAAVFPQPLPPILPAGWRRTNRFAAPKPGSPPPSQRHLLSALAIRPSTTSPEFRSWIPLTSWKVSTNSMPRTDKPLVIAGETINSRLFVGTGKYRNSTEMNQAFAAANCDLITVALRRIDFDDPASRSVLDDVDWHRYRILPNTA